MRPTLLTLLAVVCALFSAQASAAASLAHASAAPPPLAGEALGNRGSAGTARGGCNPAATSSFAWDVSGAATGFFDLPGPYPGTFRQRGFAVIGSYDPAEFAGPLQAYGSWFEIDSPVGQVIGVTSFIPDPGAIRSRGECMPDQGQFGGVAYFRYYALIRSSGWLCLASGTGTQAMNVILGQGANVDVAFETTDTFGCHPTVG